MLTHAQIWGAIDALAERCMLSPSALARKAGLDATTFNRSKRISTDGRLRWPSTESIAKALDATSQTLETFTDLLTQTVELQINPSVNQPVTFPLIGLDTLENLASPTHYFDDKGSPIFTHKVPIAQDEAQWDEMLAPLEDVTYPPTAQWGLEIVGEAYIPIYREGDRLILSAHAPIRRNDRVLIMKHDMQKQHRVVIGSVMRETAHRITIKKLDRSETEHTLDKGHIDLIARILWASQ